eukprot:gene5051-3638_t
MRRNSGSRSFISIISDTESDDTLVSDAAAASTDRRTSLISNSTEQGSLKTDFPSPKNEALNYSQSSSKSSVTSRPRSNFFHRSDTTLPPPRRPVSISTANYSGSYQLDVSSPLPSVPTKVPLPPNRVVTGFRATTIPEYKGHMPRCGHTAITYKRDFYIFGGVNNKNQYPNHLYCHEKRSLQWEEIRGVGVVPTGRANHSAVVHKNKMIIYGGHRYLDVFDDLYSYDLDARRWDKIGYEKRQGPGPVFLHAAVYIPPTQSMAIIGGFHQREYNMYVGHVFDIRNRLWNGIPGPHAINLQHLQLVTATFDMKSTSIVVLGFTEANAALMDRMPSPFVYMMDIHSYIWTKVETSSSPESPIPFRLDVIWEKFMREFIMMGGYHDNVMHSWFFPITIESIIDTRASKDSTISSPPVSNRGGRPRYGFFKLQLDDMKWSIVPTTLPKKLMAELAQKNRDSMLQKKVAASSSNSSVSKPRAMSASSSKALLKNMHSAVPGDSGLVLPPTTVEVTPQKKAMLFSVDRDPQFQRKYAYAANRDSGGKGGNASKKSKAMQYLVMHGGLDPGVDYTMLMLTPQLSRSDAFTAARIENDDGESVSTTRGGKWSDDEDENAPRSVIGKSRRYLFESASTLPNDDSKLESERSDDDSHSPKDHCLLPLLPCTQNRVNMHRFAVLFHPNNSLVKEDLLAYPTTPAVILEADKDIQQWAEQYYTDTRKWLAEKLHTVVTEDRQARRLQRKQRNSVVQEGSEEDSTSSDDNSMPSLQSKSRMDKQPTSLQDHSREAFATRRILNDAQDVQTDFFSKTGLHLFGMDDFMKPPPEPKGGPLPGVGNSASSMSHKESVDGSDVSSSNVPTSGIDRLNVKVKRHQEQQRLPSAIFSGEGEGAAHTADLGSAMAFVLMQNALEDIPQVTKEDRAHRARIRWRFLRSLVRTGEAAFVIYRVSQEEAKMKGLTVTSSPGLLLAPELHLIGPTRPYKVSSRPVPYTVSQAPPELQQFAEVTSSGMVVYHLSHYTWETFIVLPRQKGGGNNFSSGLFVCSLIYQSLFLVVFSIYYSFYRLSSTEDIISCSRRSISRTMADPEENSKFSITSEYAKKHHVNELFSHFLQLLMYHRPDDPRSFLVNEIQKMRDNSSSTSLFTEKDLETMFQLIDLTKQKWISVQQLRNTCCNLASSAGSGTLSEAQEAMVAAAGDAEGHVTWEKFKEMLNPRSQHNLDLKDRRDRCMLEFKCFISSGVESNRLLLEAVAFIIIICFFFFFLFDYSIVMILYYIYIYIYISLFATHRNSNIKNTRSGSSTGLPIWIEVTAIIALVIIIIIITSEAFSKMFEKQLSALLVAHLRQFISNLNEEQLNVSLWSGNVSLKDLELQPTFLDEMMKLFMESSEQLTAEGSGVDSLLLPFTVTKGIIRTLQLVIPWSALDQEPVSIEVTGLHVTLGPLRARPFDPDEEEARSQALKRSQLQRVEQTFYEGAPKSSQFEGGGSSKPPQVERKAMQKRNSPTGYLDQFVSTIVRNVHVVFRDVQLSYELNYPGLHPSLSALIALRINEAYVTTTDESFRDRFVYDLSIPLHKKMVATGVSIVLCAGKVGLSAVDSFHSSASMETSSTHPTSSLGQEAEKNWLHQSKIAETDAWVVKFAMSSVNSTLQGSASRRFSCSFGSSTHIFISFGAIAALQKLFDLLHYGMSHVSNRKFLPQLEPSSSSDETSVAARRWNFAISCIIAQIKARRQKSFNATTTNLGGVIFSNATRRHYCQLYKRSIGVPWLLPLQKQEEQQLHKLEVELSLEQLAFFRCFARTEISQEEAAVQLQKLYINQAKQRVASKDSRFGRIVGWFRNKEDRANGLDQDSSIKSESSGTLHTSMDFVEVLHAKWAVVQHLLHPSITVPPSGKREAKPIFSTEASVEVECPFVTVVFSPQYWVSEESGSVHFIGFLERVGQELVVQLRGIKGNWKLNGDTETENVMGEWCVVIDHIKALFRGALCSPLLESKGLEQDHPSSVPFLSVTSSNGNQSVLVSSFFVLLRPLHEMSWWSKELFHGLAFLCRLVDYEDCAPERATQPISLGEWIDGWRFKSSPCTIAIPLCNDDFPEPSELAYYSVSTPIGTLSYASSSVDLQSAVLNEERDRKPGDETTFQHPQDFSMVKEALEPLTGPRLIIKIPPLEAFAAPNTGKTLGVPQVIRIAMHEGDVSISCQVEREEKRKKCLVHTDIVQLTSAVINIDPVGNASVQINSIHVSLEPTALALLNDTLIKPQFCLDVLTMKNLEPEVDAGSDWRLKSCTELEVNGRHVFWAFESCRDVISVLCDRHYHETEAEAESKKKANDDMSTVNNNSSLESGLSARLDIIFFHAELLTLHGDRLANIEIVANDGGLANFAAVSDAASMTRSNYAIQYFITAGNSATFCISHLELNSDAGKSLFKIDDLEISQKPGILCSSTASSVCVNLDYDGPAILTALLESIASLVPGRQYASSEDRLPQTPMVVHVEKICVEIPLMPNVQGIPHAYLFVDLRKLDSRIEMIGAKTKWAVSGVVGRVQTVEDQGVAVAEYVILSTSEEFVGEARFPIVSITGESTEDEHSRLTNISFTLQGGQFSIYFPFLFELLELSQDPFYIQLATVVQDSFTSPGFTVRGDAWRNHMRLMLNPPEATSDVSFHLEGRISEVELFLATDAATPVDVTQEDTFFFTYLSQASVTVTGERFPKSNNSSSTLSVELKEVFYFPPESQNELRILFPKIRYIYKLCTSCGETKCSMSTAVQSPQERTVTLAVTVAQLCTLAAMFQYNWLSPAPTAGVPRAIESFTIESIMPPFRLIVILDKESGLQFQWKDGIRYFFKDASATISWRNFRVLLVEDAVAVVSPDAPKNCQPLLTKVEHRKQVLAEVPSLFFTAHYSPNGVAGVALPSSIRADDVKVFFHGPSWSRFNSAPCEISNFLASVEQKSSIKSPRVQKPITKNEQRGAVTGSLNKYDLWMGNFRLMMFEPWNLDYPVATLTAKTTSVGVEYSQNLKKAAVTVSAASLVAPRWNDGQRKHCTLVQLGMMAVNAERIERCNETAAACDAGNVSLDQVVSFSPFSIDVDIQKLEVIAQMDCLQRVVAFLSTEQYSLTEEKTDSLNSSEMFVAEDVYQSTIPQFLHVVLQDTSVVLPYTLGSWIIKKIDFIQSHSCQKRLATESSAVGEGNSESRASLYLSSDKYHVICLLPRVVVKDSKILLIDNEQISLPDVEVNLSVPLQRSITTAELPSENACVAQKDEAWESESSLLSAKRWRFVPLSYLLLVKVQLLFEICFVLDSAFPWELTDTMLKSISKAYANISSEKCGSLPVYYSPPASTEEQLNSIREAGSENLKLRKCWSVKGVLSPFECGLCTRSSTAAYAPGRIMVIKLFDPIRLYMKESSSTDFTAEVVFGGNFEILDSMSSSILHGAPHEGDGGDRSLSSTAVIGIRATKDSFFITTKIIGSIAFNCNLQAMELIVKLHRFYNSAFGEFPKESQRASSALNHQTLRTTHFTTIVHRAVWIIEDVAEIEFRDADLAIFPKSKLPTEPVDGDKRDLYVVCVNNISLRDLKSKNLLAQATVTELHVGIGSIAVQLQHLCGSQLEMYPLIAKRISALQEHLFGTVQFPKKMEKQFERKFILSIQCVEGFIKSNEAELVDKHIRICFPGLFVKGSVSHTKAEYLLDADRVNIVFADGKGQKEYFSLLDNFAISVKFEEDLMDRRCLLAIRCGKLDFRLPTAERLRSLAFSVVCVLKPFTTSSCVPLKSMITADVREGSIAVTDKHTVSTIESPVSDRWLARRFSFFIPEFSLTLSNGTDALNPRDSGMVMLRLKNAGAEWHANSTSDVTLVEINSITSVVDETLSPQGPFLIARGTGGSVDPQLKFGFLLRHEKLLVTEYRSHDDTLLPSEKITSTVRINNCLLTLSPELLNALNSCVLTPLSAALRVNPRDNSDSRERGSKTDGSTKKQERKNEQFNAGLVSFEDNVVVVTSDVCISSEGVAFHFKKNANAPFPRNVINVTSSYGAKIWVTPISLPSGSRRPALLIDEGLTVNIIGTPMAVAAPALDDVVYLGDRAIMNISEEDLTFLPQQDNSTLLDKRVKSLCSRVFRQIDLDIIGDITIVAWSKADKLNLSLKVYANYHLEKVFCETIPTLSDYITEHGNIEFRDVSVTSNEAVVSRSFNFRAKVDHRQIEQTSGLSTMEVLLPPVAFSLSFSQLQLLIRMMHQLRESGILMWETMGEPVEAFPALRKSLSNRVETQPPERQSLLELSFSTPSIRLTFTNDLQKPLVVLSSENISACANGNRDLSHLKCELRGSLLVQDYPMFCSVRTLLAVTPELSISYSWFIQGSSSLEVALTCSKATITIPLLSLYNVYKCDFQSQMITRSFFLINELGRSITVLLPTEEILVVQPAASINTTWSLGKTTSLYLLLGESCSVENVTPEEVKKLGFRIDASDFHDSGLYRVSMVRKSVGVLDSVFRFQEQDHSIRVTTSVMVENCLASSTLRLSGGFCLAPGESHYASLDSLVLPLEISVDDYQFCFTPCKNITLEALITAFLVLPDEEATSFVGKMVPNAMNCKCRIENSDIALFTLKLQRNGGSTSARGCDTILTSLVLQKQMRPDKCLHNPLLLSKFDVVMRFLPFFTIVNYTGDMLYVSMRGRRLSSESDGHSLMHKESFDFFPSAIDVDAVEHLMFHFLFHDAGFSCEGSVDLSSLPLNSKQIIPLYRAAEPCGKAVIAEHVKLGVVVIRPAAFVRNNCPCSVKISFSWGSSCTSPITIPSSAQLPVYLPYSLTSPGNTEMPVSLRLAACDEHATTPDWSDPVVCDTLMPPTTLLTKVYSSRNSLQLVVRPTSFLGKEPLNEVEIVPKWIVVNALPWNLELKYRDMSFCEVAAVASAQETISLMECPTSCAGDPEIQFRLKLEGIECDWTTPVLFGSFASAGISLLWKYRLPTSVIRNASNLRFFEACRVPTHPDAPMEKEVFINLHLSATSESCQNQLTISEDPSLPLVIENRSGKNLQIRELASFHRKTFCATTLPSTWAYFVPTYSDVRLSFEILSQHLPQIRIDLLDERENNASILLQNLSEASVSEEAQRLGSSLFVSVTANAESLCYTVTVTENIVLDRCMLFSRRVVHLDVLIETLSLYVASPWTKETIADDEKRYFLELARNGLHLSGHEESDVSSDSESLYLLNSRELDLFAVCITGLYFSSVCNEKHTTGNGSVGRVEFLDCTSPAPVYPIVVRISPEQKREVKKGSGFQERCAEPHTPSQSMTSCVPCISTAYHLLFPRVSARSEESKRRSAAKVIIKQLSVRVGCVSVQLHDAFIYTMRSAIARLIEVYKKEEILRESKAKYPTVQDYTLQDFVIFPVSLRVTLTRSSDKSIDPFKNIFNIGTPFVVPSVEDAPLLFASVRLQNCHLRGAHPFKLMAKALWKAYRIPVYIQLYKVIGSLEILGNPVALLAGWSRGFRSLIASTAALDPLNGAQEFLKEATSSTLHSLGLLSHIGSDVAAKVTLDKRFPRSPMPSGASQRSLVKGIANGVTSGVRGVFQKPLAGARDRGIPGFISGMAGGVACLVSHPLSGALQTVGDTAEFLSSILETESPDSILEAYIESNRNFSKSSNSRRMDDHLGSTYVGEAFMTPGQFDLLVNKTILQGRSLSRCNIAAVTSRVGIHNVVFYGSFQALINCLSEDELYQWMEIIIVGGCAKCLRAQQDRTCNLDFLAGRTSRSHNNITDLAVALSLKHLKERLLFILLPVPSVVLSLLFQGSDDTSRENKGFQD